jgi:outer membrane protein assembly factor BamA
VCAKSVHLFSFLDMRSYINFFCTIIILCVSVVNLVAMRDTSIIPSTTIADSTGVRKKSKLIIYPVAFYLPETRWGGGVVGLYKFRFKKESSESYPSVIQYSVNYTQNKQVIVTFPYEMYWGENKNKIKGELAYFDYLYNFYGIGPNTKEEDLEKFSAKYPRLRMDYLRRYKDTYVGVRARFDNFNLYKVKENGILDTVNQITGRSGGKISGLGLIAQYDTRDFLYNSTKGMYAEVEIHTEQVWTGSDFRYTRFSTDVTKYIGLKEKHILVLNSVIGTLVGDPIFYELFHLGSPKQIRGYQDRRFIDRNIITFNTEYRYPIYKRFNGVAFTALGNVAPTFGKLFDQTPKFTYGVGLRYTLNKEDRLRLRLDYALTLTEGSAFYLTANDAF